MIDEDLRVKSDALAMKSGKLAAPPRYKIALYGFGSQPAVHRYLIDLAAKHGLPISWCAILTTPHFREVICEVLPANEILDVFRTLPREPLRSDPAALSDYPGSFVEDLAAQKRRRRHRSRQWLQARGIDYYRLFKEFLRARGATHILMSSVETPEAKIALAAARGLGLRVIVPVLMRNITGTYFSVDCWETPPAYATADPVSRAKAADFIRRFRESPLPAYVVPPEMDSYAEYEVLPDFIPSLPQRIKRLTTYALERPDIFDHDELRRAVMNNFAFLRASIRGVRSWQNAGQFDIAELGALPKRFIYYPLHYTPESSINTPAPFFVDQLRVIDALRFAMPSDCLLVVKEHPACLKMRPVDFIRKVSKLPGVTVVNVSVPSIEVIKRATLTATVTGTAAFEAFLLGRPTLTLGQHLPAWVVGRMSHMENLRSEILSAINEPISEEFIVDQVAKLMSVRYPFFFDTPRLPGEPVMRRPNIEGFMSALVDHLAREHQHEWQMPNRALDRNM